MKFDLSLSSDYKKAIELIDSIKKNGSIVEIVKKSNNRTLTQNSALHLMFSQLAEELNSQGLDQRKTLKPSVSIPWSKDSVKELLWRPIQEAVVDKESTTDLTTKEIDEVFRIMQIHLHSVVGISIEFPSIETLINKQRFK